MTLECPLRILPAAVPLQKFLLRDPVGKGNISNHECCCVWLLAWLYEIRMLWVGETESFIFHPHSSFTLRVGGIKYYFVTHFTVDFIWIFFHRFMWSAHGYVIVVWCRLVLLVKLYWARLVGFLSVRILIKC